MKRIKMTDGRTQHGRARRLLLRELLLKEHESEDDSRKRRIDMVRAGGDCVCDQCGEKFYDHPSDPVDTFLNILCDRRRVKL